MITTFDIRYTGGKSELEFCWTPGITREVYDRVCDAAKESLYELTEDHRYGHTTEGDLITSAKWIAIPWMDQAMRMSDAIWEATR
jgi:hypothetical protein